MWDPMWLYACDPTRDKLQGCIQEVAVGQRLKQEERNCIPQRIDYPMVCKSINARKIIFCGQLLHFSV